MINSRPFIISVIALIISLILSVLLSTPTWAEGTHNKKAIILILDATTLDEITKAKTPNIDSLTTTGALAFMNIRAKSNLANRGSGFLSMGMGVRTLASTKGGQAYNRNEVILTTENQKQSKVKAQDLYTLYTGRPVPEGEIINLAIADVKRSTFSITPNNQVGLFGKTAKAEGLIVGLVGNSDTSVLGREASLLAMDEKGAIPYGYVSSDLLMEDKDVLGGLRLGQDKVLNEIKRILPKVDILFIDYGDTVRIQENDDLAMDEIQINQKLKAIERADYILGKVVDQLDLSKTLFMVITPNPSQKAIKDGNFGLTPVIMSSPDTKKGLLVSNTTRQEGLVTNFDFAPTIFNFFRTSQPEGYIGEQMKVASYEAPSEKLLKNQQIYLSLRKYRYVFHWLYIALVGITLVSLFMPYFSKWKGLKAKHIELLGLMVFAFPVTVMTVSLFGYFSIIFDLAYIILLSFIIAYILNKIFSNLLISLGLLSFITSLFILVDTYFGGKLMIISPLGSDAIAGGRFYGIGNDYMGMLLGSSILSIFSFAQIKGIKNSSLLVLTATYMIIIAVSLSPLFGANVGGTLAALTILLLAVLKIVDYNISFKMMILVIIVVLTGIIGLASIDAFFNPNPTHAGKAIQSLATGGWVRFIEIIAIKIGQVLWNLVNAIWNYILFIELVIILLIAKYRNEPLADLKISNQQLGKGFSLIALGAAVVFTFNDTGTIAAAIMMIYLHVPLGLIFKKLIDN